jgi:hypothetical protein
MVGDTNGLVTYVGEKGIGDFTLGLVETMGDWRSG